jgi:hypothetical protein
MAIVKKYLGLAIATFLLMETNNAMVGPYRPNSQVEQQRDSRRRPRADNETSLWHSYLLALINKVPDLMSHLTFIIYNNLSSESKQKVIASTTQIAFWGSMLGVLFGSFTAAYRHYALHVPITKNMTILAVSCLITMLGSGAYLAGSKVAHNTKIPPQNNPYMQINLTFESHVKTSSYNSCSPQLDLFEDHPSQQAMDSFPAEQHALLDLQKRKIRTVLQHGATDSSLTPAFVYLKIGFYPPNQQERKVLTPTTEALTTVPTHDSSCKNCTTKAPA